MSSILNQTDEEYAEEYLRRKESVKRLVSEDNEFHIVFDENSDINRRNAVVSYATVILGDDADIVTHSMPDSNPISEDADETNFHYFTNSDDGDVYSRIVYGDNEE